MRKIITFISFSIVFIGCKSSLEDSKYQLVYDTYSDSEFEYVYISEQTDTIQYPTLELVEIDDELDYGTSIISEFDRYIYIISGSRKSIRVYPIEDDGTIIPDLKYRFAAEGNGPGEYAEIFGLTFIDSTLYLLDGPKFKINSYDTNFNHIEDYHIPDIRPSLGDFASINQDIIYTTLNHTDFILRLFDTSSKKSGIEFFEKLIKNNLQPRIYNSVIIKSNGNELIVGSRYLPFIYIFDAKSIGKSQPDKIIRLGSSLFEMMGKENEFSSLGGINSLTNPPLEPIESDVQLAVGGTPAIQSIAVNQSWLFIIATEGNKLITLRRSSKGWAHFGTFLIGDSGNHFKASRIHLVRDILYLSNNTNTIGMINLRNLK